MCLLNSILEKSPQPKTNSLSMEKAKNGTKESEENEIQEGDDVTSAPTAGTAASGTSGMAKQCLHQTIFTSLFVIRPLE